MRPGTDGWTCGRTDGWTDDRPAHRVERVVKENERLLADALLEADCEDSKKLVHRAHHRTLPPARPERARACARSGARCAVQMPALPTVTLGGFPGRLFMPLRGGRLTEEMLAKMVRSLFRLIAAQPAVQRSSDCYWYP